MLLVQLPPREQAASAAPSPSLHILRILPDYYTAVEEVVRMVQVRTRTSLLHSVWAAGRAPDMIRVSDVAARPAFEQQDIRTRRSRRAEDDGAHHIGIEAVSKDASDLGQTRIHAARGVHNIGRRETLDLHYAPLSRLARTPALRLAAESLVDRFCDAALRIFDSASDSYLARAHMAPHVLRPCTGKTVMACDGHEVCPYDAEVQLVWAVLQNPALECDGHCDDILRTWSR